MSCASCGHESPEQAKFCAECGQALARGCTSCSSELPPGAKFCPECGAAAPAPGAASESRPVLGRAPADYTPKHLADKILQSKSALEGERKQVTVMFADVKGSMELAEQLDPEQWHRILERFFEILSDGVHRFEGTVNQYTGDGIMALFGAPIAHEDHAQRACYAALQLREELREFTREVKRAHEVDFAVRIGLNSGDVVVGKIGDDLRMDYTAQGHTVGLAQRMESLASGGSTYLSEASASLVREYFALEDLGEFSVKGAAEPLRVFELTGSGTARTRFDVSRDRGLASFVGRSDETALLETALEQALAGPGRAIGVVAQAGTGKSRLCYEFIEGARRRGITVYEARGLSHGAKIPLLPIQELMRDFFGIEERDSDRVAREKIAGRTLLLDETLGNELPIFFDLLGVPDPARPLPEADPDALKRRMYAAVRAIVKSDGQLDPGVLLIEDLHWLDPASDAVLTQIIEANAESQSLVLVNFRPEYRGAWMQQAQYQQLSLLPLNENALRDLLRELLGDDSSVAELPQTIYERTGGNPFFIEEVVQSLIEDGHLQGSRGAYRLTTQIGAVRMPESVQALLAARIDRLAEREKHVLQSASVVGKNFRESVLQSVAELPQADLAAALQTLQAGEFIYEAALYPVHEYAFKHPLTQEVAERSQLAERRAQRHALVASAYEEIDPEHLDERAALLAHHWEHAGEKLRAAHWHARAAGRLGSTDYREAYLHWKRVDELVQQVDGPESAELQARAFIELTLGAFRVEVPVHESDALFERGRSSLQASGDDASLARLTSAYATIAQTRGHLVRYLELATQAGEVARRVGDPGLRAFCALEECYALTCHGALAEAVAKGDEIVALANGDAELGSDVGYSPLIVCLGFPSGPLAFMGRLDEAEKRIDKALQMAGGEIAETLVWLTLWKIDVQNAFGDHAAALQSGRRCLSLAEASGSVFDPIAAHAWLATSHVGLGEWDEAIAAFGRARAASESNGGAARDVLVMTSWVEARGQLGLGNLDRAHALIDSAIQVCTEQQTRVYLCRCLIVRAMLHLACGRDVDAETDLAAAERLVEETGARLWQPAILEVRGQREEALSLYRAMGAHGHVARLEG